MSDKHNIGNLRFLKFLLIFSAFLLFSTLFVTTTSADEIQVNAQVDRTSISIEDSLTLTVTINGGESDIDTSGIVDFNIFSHSTSSNISFINGSFINEFRHVYSMSPKTSGRLVIPPLTVTKGRKKYLTNEIVVNVSKESVVQDPNTNAFVTATISSDSLYTGEQLVYTFSFIRNIRIANLRYSRPSFEGFTSKEIGEEKQYKKIINNTEYVVSEIQILLTPIKSGEITIEPSVLNCDIVIQTQNNNNRSPFNSFFNDSFFGATKTKRKILKTEEKKVLIKELPEYSFSEPFTGVVGKIGLNVSLDNTTIKSGDSATLSITISGSGNLSDAESPSITTPEGFKIYSDTPETEIKTTANGFSGKKTFKSVLVALKPGEYQIGPIKFPYFNTEKEKYVMLQSKIFNINVKPSENRTSSIPEASKSEQDITKKVIKKRIEYTGHDILPIKENIDAIKNQKQLSLKAHLFILLLPILLTIAIIILSGLMQKEKKPKSIMQKKVKEFLKIASHDSIPNTVFLSTVYKTLVYSISSNSNNSGNSLTRHEAEIILDRKNIDENSIAEILNLFDRIEGLRFSRQDISFKEKKEILRQTKNAVRRIS